MENFNPPLKAVLNLVLLQSRMIKRFDRSLGLHGISLNEFMILFYLNSAPEEKMRRIDLAERVGLSASGVTRMLLPMEKIGLVERAASARDARVSFVKLSSGGKRIFIEALATMDQTSTNYLSLLNEKKIEKLQKLLVQMGGTVE